MARPVYSTNFLTTGLQTTGQPSYTVPTGFVASLRGATFYKATAATATPCYMAVTSSGGTVATVVWIFLGASVTAVQSEVWNGMVVVPAGEKIIMARLSGAGNWYGTANGFLLQAV